MRKPASDVAGIEEVNAKQDKIGYTPADDSKVVHSTDTSNWQKQAMFNPGDYKIDTTSPTTDFATLLRTKYNKGGIVYIRENNGPSYAQFIDAVVICEGIGYWYAYGITQSNYFAHRQITPTYDSGWVIDAEDSQVAHLSGANNFDTVPTVNNNPLLLASSLPSDLARTGSNQEFTGKNTFDTAPIDKTTGNPYITKDGVPSIPSDVARTGQAQTFTAAQTFSIAPTITDASQDKGDNQAATMADLKSVEKSAWHYIETKDIGGKAQIALLYQKDVAKKCIYVIFKASLGTGDYSSGYTIKLDMSSVVKSFDNYASTFSTSSNPDGTKSYYNTVVSGSIINFVTFTGTISESSTAIFASDLLQSTSSLKESNTLGVSEFA